MQVAKSDACLRVPVKFHFKVAFKFSLMSAEKGLPSGMLDCMTHRLTCCVEIEGLAKDMLAKELLMLARWSSWSLSVVRLLLVPPVGPPSRGVLLSESLL